MKKTLSFVMVLALVVGIFAAAFSFVASAEADYEVVAATWKKGSYYDILTEGTNNRYYTVVKFNEGDKIKVQLPTDKWVIYACLADATGIFDADGNGKYDYVTVAGGSTWEYTVEAIGDRIPSEVRLTVCPNPDAVITDEMWATFDGVVSIDTTAGYAPDGNFWTKRAFYGKLDTDKTVNTRRHLILDVEEGDTVNLTFPTAGKWLVWFYAADADGTLLNVAGTTNYLAVTENLAYEIKAIGDKVPAKVYLTMQLKDEVSGYSFTKEDWKAFDVEVSVEEAFDPAALDEVTDGVLDIEWRKGQFYAQYFDYVKTRRYTGFAVEAGDKLYFDLPSDDWHIWVYAHDDTGCIKYYDQAVDGTVITIEEIDGRMPTKVYINILPVPNNRELEDNEWVFDFKIALNTPFESEEETSDPAALDEVTDGVLDIEWRKGQFYAQYFDYVKTRRYTGFAVEAGDKLYFDVPSDDWHIWVYAHDDAGYIKYYDQAVDGTVITIEEIDGRMPTKVYINILPVPNNRELEDNEWVFDFKIALNTPFESEENPGTSDFSASYAVLAAALALIAVSGVLVARKRRNSAN